MTEFEGLDLPPVDIGEAVFARQVRHAMHAAALAHHVAVAGQCGHGASEIARRLGARELGSLAPS